MSSYGTRLLALLVVLALIAGLVAMYSEQHPTSVPESHTESAPIEGPDTGVTSPLSTEPTEPAPAAPAPAEPAPSPP